MKHRLLFIMRDRDGWFYSGVGVHGTFTPQLARARSFAKVETAAEALMALRDHNPRTKYTLIDVDIELGALWEEPEEPAEPPRPITTGHPQTELHTPPARPATSGHACPTCGNFSLVQNGTCSLCTICGETTGCS